MVPVGFPSQVATGFFTGKEVREYTAVETKHIASAQHFRKLYIATQLYKPASEHTIIIITS